MRSCACVCTSNGSDFHALIAVSSAVEDILMKDFNRWLVVAASLAMKVDMVSQLTGTARTLSL